MDSNMKVLLVALIDRAYNTIGVIFTLVSKKKTSSSNVVVGLVRLTGHPSRHPLEINSRLYKKNRHRPLADLYRSSPTSKPESQAGHGGCVAW